MAAPSSSNVPASKPLSLSYADRARLASASQPAHSASRARPSGPNVKTRSGDESTSPASSSRNLTPNSTAALTLPGSPPPSSSQTNIEEQQAFPPMPKSPTKPPLANVWAARREQRERAVGVQQQQGHASASVQTENSPPQTSTTTGRAPINGINAPSSLDDLTSGDHDTFVVHVTPHRHAQGRANASSASLTPPSLDDADSWPEMGKGAPSSSTSVSGSIAEMDKKDGPSKKAEKPKWVQIPPAELQAAHDAQSAANSRPHSQHRRGNQTKSRSRQQSQARSTLNQGQSQNRSQNQAQSYVASLSNGSGVGPKAGETSSVQSRAESTTHSRTTSVHSSPRIGMRGRRLPEEQSGAPNTAAASSTAAAKRLPNGISTVEEQPPLPQPAESQSIPSSQRSYQDNITFISPPQSLSAPRSRSQTPYSHSPVYYPPPHSGPQGFAYAPIPASAGYVIPPPPVPSPGSGGPSMQQQGFVAYASYGIPQQFPSGQPPFPYMYQPVPYPYYPAPIPDQQLESQAPPYQGNTQQGEAASHLSPILPPASTMTRPPPPQESEALSGYRTIVAVPVSPLIDGSTSRQNISEVVEGGTEMVFGSVGQPGGLKSPSPAPPLPSASSVSEAGKQGSKKTQTTFAVGFEGSAAIRVRRTVSGRDVVDEVADSIKVIDLTDKGSRWQFGTSAQQDSEPLPNENAEQSGEPYDQNEPTQQQLDSQILQPQPHHMLHYPPPNVSPAFQVGGYNMVPQMQMQMPPVPLPSQSPQNNVQPLPSHVPSLAPLPLNPGFVSPLVLSSPGPGTHSSGHTLVPMTGMTSGGDEWEVRDFGYGFGQGYMPDRREDRFERGNYRDSNLREASDFGAGRMRRSSTTGGYGPGYYEGPRGGFGGRRGRGQNGFGRGFSRGSFGGRGGHSNFQRHQPSLSVSTGPFQQQQSTQQQQPQMSPDISNPNGYFVSPTTSTSQYMASPYGQFNSTFVPPQSQVPPSAQSQSQYLQHPQAPPVPMPVTTLSFPLDPTRLYLLGQLEYYFGAQNLASDIYLKKQMDSKGWIPISLIASFNRVRQLTQDAQFVKEVLGISSLVEVRGNHVRLANQQWANYVLPGAIESTVECEETEKETEEGEEDDVVFILGGEESRPWVGAT
ncbi:hypothetical protein ACEPAF_2259 [Sanghuangporus sanghuang]